MVKDSREWLTQAEYDFQTAEYMFEGGRYVYAVFMAHLALEKALKGVYQKRLQDFPPKTHNLIYFLGRLELKPPQAIGEFLVKLDQASIATRYPDELKRVQRIYVEPVVKEILLQTKEALEWVNKMF